MISLRIVVLLSMLAGGLMIAPTASAQDAAPADMNFEFDEGGEFAGFGDADFEAEFGPGEEATLAAAAGVIICYGVVLLVGIIVQLFICYLLYDALSAVPEEHRELDAWVPWLLLVPFVNIVVLFLAFIKTPRSLAKALAAKGDTSLGDCGENTGLWGAVLSLIPCVNIAGLVMLIMVLLKIGQAKKLLRSIA